MTLSLSLLLLLAPPTSNDKLAPEAGFAASTSKAQPQAAAPTPTAKVEKKKKRRGPPEGPFAPTLLPYDGPKPTWKKRERAGIKLRSKYRDLIDLGRWPAEPEGPAEVDAARFEEAFAKLCGRRITEKKALEYGGWILEEAAAWKIDPFLLGSVVYRQSRCNPKHKGDFGVGLAGLNAGMYRFDKDTLTYHVLEGGAWVERSMTFKHRWTHGNLKRPRRNLHFAAGLMAMWKAQWPAIAGAFGSAPHRHYISHYLWGDAVKSASGEDRVLRGRRRLLAYYNGDTPTAKGSQNGVALICPLEGAPRKIGSRMGDDRAGGKRRHMGVDFVSSAGEPVLAVADGTVIVAGVDTKGPGNRNMPSRQARRFPASKMGAGGLFVMIRHDNGLRSAYMHLSGYAVQAKDKVKAGQVIGWVGHSGIKQSGAHLHFELRGEGRYYDPFVALEPYLFDPMESYRGHRQARAQHQARRERRRAAWRKRKAAREAKKAKQAQD